MKIKYLYHGSGKKLIGEKLIPRQARGLDDKNVANSLKGVYASSVKNEAISMALHSCKGVKSGSLQMHKINGKLKVKDSIIYLGWPKQKYIYLYTFSPKTFINKPKGSSQWISLKKVKPIKIEKLLVKDYIHLIKKATKKEKQNWFKSYGIKKEK